MELATASDSLTTLSHPGRLSVFRLLVRRMPDGVRPSEIAAALGLKPNTLSVYVSALERTGMVTSRRQGTSIFYRANLAAMGALVDFLVADCCRNRPDLCLPHPGPATSQKGPAMSRRYNVLFICTGNSARSIFAETLLASEGGDRFAAHSAGIKPQSGLNPYAVEVLTRAGHDTSALRSKHVSEFQTADAPVMDFVFTVCDAAANEECPAWHGQPVTAHWGLPDPVKVQGTSAEKSYAFANTYAQMRRRIQAFVSLPMDQLDKITLQQRLDGIGSRADA